jgi:hypothetical protein
MSLTVEQATDLVDRYIRRRDRFPEEEEREAFLVVLLNYGDHLTRVHCINGEWQGTKDEIPPKDGLPLCPNGHPMLETGPIFRLSLLAEPF